MNKKDAMRIALAVEASYILSGAETNCIIDNLSEVDAEKSGKLKESLVLSCLKKLDSLRL